ncbi:MAG: BadF/BadG/BcrA/BcrD ATPase family protein, partial [Actinomycetota bacterium]
QTLGWSATTAAVNDTFAVLRAGLDDVGQPWGVAVTCGAGINCVGVDAAGRTATFLALGVITGDWGGGSGLGRAALWHGMRAGDGRGPATTLASAVASHFGLPTVRDVAIAIHLGAISEYELVALAAAVLAAADAADGVAVRLVHRQAEEICLMALAAMRRLELTGLATPVVLGGGLMMARNPLLSAQIAAGIAAGAPRATVCTVDVPPVVGAALLGLDHAGAPPDAEHRLRATCSGKVRL